MRCQKCGRGLGLIHKKCPKCGTPVQPEQRKKFLIVCIVWFGVFFVLASVMYYFSSHSQNVQNYTNGQNFFGAIVAAIISAFVLFLLYKLVRFTIRRPVWGTIISMFLFGPSIIGGLIFYQLYHQASVLADIQNNLAEIASAKLLGDSIIKKVKLADSSLNDVKSSIAVVAEKLMELSAPDQLKNYQAAAILWSVRVSSAAEQTADWKNLKNQPDAFPLAISDGDAKTYFDSSIQAIADLKKAGVNAIQEKNREAMRVIAAKLLVQQHWLKAILYSQSNSLTFNFAAPVLAVSGLASIPDVKGINVTCSVCDYPDAYKVKWTDKLRKQYGCDTKCHPSTGTLTSGGANQQQSQNQNQNGQNQTTEKNAGTSNEEKYAEALVAYTYKDIPKRAVCIGAGGVSTGGATTRKYCVEEAVQSTNDIAASAIGFAESTKSLTVDQWNDEYEDIDFAFALENTTNEIGTAPSQPSAEGGHKEGGMGTIQQGEPIVAPKTTPAPKPTLVQGIQDVLKGIRGTFTVYSVTDNCSERYYPDTYNQNRDWTDTMPKVFRVRYGLVEDDFPGTPAQYVDSSGKVVFVQVHSDTQNSSRTITNTVQFSQEGQKIKLSGTQNDVTKQTFSSGDRLERICNASYSDYLTIVNYDP